MSLYGNCSDGSTSGVSGSLFLLLLFYILCSVLSCSCYRVHRYHPHCGLTVWREDRGSKQQWSQPMREVCATRKACPCHGGNKSVSTLAQYKVCECSSQRTIQKTLLGVWRRVGHSQDKLPSHFHCLSVCISICLPTFLSLPEHDEGFFQLKAEEGKPPP